jgi:hypothetical protein
MGDVGSTCSFRSPDEWWRGLNPQTQKQWAPILRAMTPEQREAFHAERRELALGLPDPDYRFFASLSNPLYDALFDKWSHEVRT